MNPLLSVKNLTTHIHTRDQVLVANDKLSFTIENSQTLSIVGESGSGKSMLCYSLLGLLPKNAQVVSGNAYFGDIDLMDCNPSVLRSIRGNQISMIFQDPNASLNPYLTIGQQLIEPLQTHKKINKKNAWQQAIEALEEVKIPNSTERMRHFPHQLSGGMRQRVMIAMTLINQPKLLIADEPTTALDATIQAQILELIKSLQEKHKLAVIFITHDLNIANKISDAIIVMQQGKIVDQGTRNEIFKSDKINAYTQKLINASPRSAKSWPNNSSENILLSINDVSSEYVTKTGFSLRNNKYINKAVCNVNLTIKEGEIVGLVGESGSGKSTLARNIMRLVDIKTGDIYFRNSNITAVSKNTLQVIRKNLQMVFQNPYSSLNPRMSIYDILAEPLLVNTILTKKQVSEKVKNLLKDVALPEDSLYKYPHEFSGGQRQRIAIARALAMEPDFIIADEPVSALDVTTQAKILELLLTLNQKYNISILFISHDLAVVRYIADKVAVMQQGKIIECKETESIFKNPEQSYTKKLIQSIPNTHFN